MRLRFVLKIIRITICGSNQTIVCCQIHESISKKLERHPPPQFSKTATLVPCKLGAPPSFQLSAKLALCKLRPLLFSTNSKIGSIQIREPHLLSFHLKAKLARYTLGPPTSITAICETGLGTVIPETTLKPRSRPLLKKNSAVEINLFGQM